MKTRIACYFDVPRPDNRQDDINWVDVRARTHRSISPSTITLDRFVSHPIIAQRRRPTDILPPLRPSQIDMKHTDMKNDVKRKVAAKTGVPMWRLSMRLGPFQEVYMFDKGAKNGIMPRTFGLTEAVYRPDLIGNARFDATYFGGFNEDFPEEEPNPLADGWKQTWDGPNGVKEALKQYEPRKKPTAGAPFKHHDHVSKK